MNWWQGGHRLQTTGPIIKGSKMPQVHGDFYYRRKSRLRRAVGITRVLANTNLDPREVVVRKSWVNQVQWLWDQIPLRCHACKKRSLYKGLVLDKRTRERKEDRKMTDLSANMFSVMISFQSAQATLPLTHRDIGVRIGKNVSRSPLAEWPLSRCLCVCPVIRARSSAFQPAGPRGDCCLPLTQILSGLCTGLPGVASLALGAVIHKVQYLFASKEVNRTRDRADCVCRALLMCSARRQKGRRWKVKVEEAWRPIWNSDGQNILHNLTLFFLQAPAKPFNVLVQRVLLFLILLTV